VIFEEAAGITKYKIKKREATRKLKYAEDNLVRLRDIITELNAQIGTLSRQAAKARRFKKLSSELEFLDSQHTLRRYRELEESIERDRESLVTGESDVERIRRELSEREQRHQDENRESSELDLRFRDLTRSRHELENRVSQLEQASEFKQSRIADIRTRLREESSDREVFEKRFQELETQLNQCIENRESIAGAFEHKKGDVENTSGDISRLMAEIENKKRFLMEFREKLEALNNRSSETQGKLLEFNILQKNIEQQIEKIEDEASEIRLSLNFEEDQLDAARQKNDTARDKLEEINGALERRSEARKQSTRELEALESGMLSFSSELSEKDSRRNALSELKNSYEGFFSGVRAVMRSKQEHPGEWEGIVGVVPDVIKVENGYEVAAEAALGARIQNVIVEKGEDAHRAIDFLKRHRLGRVTFLPLDLVRPRGEGRKAPADGRVVGKLLDFIRYDSRYSAVMDSLLGNVLVVRTLPDGIALMREGLRGFNLITPEGELISGSGAITGGELKSSVKGVFSRENEIEELEARVAELRDILIRKNEERNRLRETVAAAEAELEKLKDLRNRATSDLHQASSEYQKVLFQRDSLKKRLDALDAESDRARERIDSLCSRREELSGSLENSSQENLDIRRAITDHERELEALYDETTRHKEELARRQTALGNLEEKLGGIDERAREIRNEIRERREWLENLDHNHGEQHRQIEELEKEIRSGNERVGQLKEEDERLAEEIKRVQETLETLRLRNEDFEEARRALQNELDAIHESTTRLKVRITEFEGRMNRQREHLYAKYQLRIENVDNRESEIKVPWEEVPDRIETLEGRIRRLGNVNLDAIEQLEKLEERHTYLADQEKDLSAAKGQLVSVIDKINDIATKRFEETFDKVKVYFNEIFTQLFEGGKAELKLMECDDLLEAGIDIVARPPGKHFQNISLLSGGEKALTATALLFALFKVKPSPFCVIDELDAPLDDTNIGRFTRLLKHFCEFTQFLVITHNKNTIKIADLLYGVTQPEKGVSRIISVKFVDEDLDYLLKESRMPAGKLPRSKRTVELKEDEEMAGLELPHIRELHLRIPEDKPAQEAPLREESPSPAPADSPERNAAENGSPAENTGEAEETVPQPIPESLEERMKPVDLPPDRAPASSTLLANESPADADSETEPQPLRSSPNRSADN
jgi:chromosome segregation protein